MAVLQQTCSLLSPIMFSVIGIICLLSYLPMFRPGLATLVNPQDVQLAVGALVGTVLALGFSLSIIPIQRAAEVYSPSIVRLFREATTVRYSFLALFAICFLSFGSVLAPIVGIEPTSTIPVLMLFLGVGLDLLRLLYLSITKLLEPKEAVWRLEREARDTLIRLHRKLEKAADLSWRALPPEKQARYTRESFLKLFYSDNPVHDSTVESRAAELTEITQKAVERADWSLALQATDALRQLAIDSIEIRKTALTYSVVEIMVVKANAEKLLDKIYEFMLSINRAAVRRGAENVSIRVVRALGLVAQHMTTIRRDPPREDSAPLVSNPISYCRTAIREAMTAGMDDVGYEGAATLARISQVSPTHTSNRDVHIYTMEGLFEILRSFLAVPGKSIHLHEPLKRALEVLHTLSERKDFHLKAVTHDFLEEIQALVPVTVLRERKQLGGLLHLSLAPAYDISYEFSLPRLVERSTSLIRADPECPWVSPWHDFLDFNEEVYRHLLAMSKAPDLAASQLMFYLIQAEQMIASIYLDQLRATVKSNREHTEEIEQHVYWFISFFRSSAHHANSMDRHWTENAADCLGWIGIAYLNEGFNNSALSAAQSIASITANAAEKIEAVRTEDLAELLVPLRLMKALAQLISNVAMQEQIHEEEAKVLAKLAQHPNLKSELDARGELCLRELTKGRGGYIADPNCARALLARILQNRAANPGNTER